MLADRDPLLVAFRQANEEAEAAALATAAAREARAQRDARLGHLARLEHAAGAQRVRSRDRFPRLVAFVAGEGALRTSAVAAQIPEGTPAATAEAIRAEHEEAAVADWEARVRDREASRARFVDLVRCLREHQITYNEICEFLRSADARFYLQAPGPIVAAYVNADRSWRSHGPGGRRLLSDAIRQLMARA